MRISTEQLEIGKLLHRLIGDLRYALVLISQRSAPKCRTAIEKALAGIIIHIDAFAFGDNGRASIEVLEQIGGF
jgi:hypothetical protein